MFPVAPYKETPVNHVQEASQIIENGAHRIYQSPGRNPPPGASLHQIIFVPSHRQPYQPRVQNLFQSAKRLNHGRIKREEIYYLPSIVSKDLALQISTSEKSGSIIRGRMGLSAPDARIIECGLIMLTWDGL